jgi:hypothetical protein
MILMTEAGVGVPIDLNPYIHCSFLSLASLGTHNHQAPAWDLAVKLFADNDKIAFGDVNLDDGNVKMLGGVNQADDGNPKGWPIIRFFNKATGPGGKPYKMKNDDPGYKPCKELGQQKFMNAYVEEAAGVETPPCSLTNNWMCNEQEKVRVGTQFSVCQF